MLLTLKEIKISKYFCQSFLKDLLFYNYIKNGELKSEGGSITEGIGSSRVTKNFENAKIDDAYLLDDP